MVLCPQILAAAAITVLAALATGCSLVRSESFEALVESKPELAERPVTVTIPREPGGRKVALDDLALDLPADWEVGPVRTLCPGSPYFGYGQSLMVNLVAVDGARRVPVEAFYRQESSWLESPPPSMLTAVARALREPRKFLARYRTDLNLLEATYQVRPGDVAAASGAEQKRLAALVWMKSHLPLPATRLALRQGTAFACRCTADPGLLAALFDAEGRRRGELLLSFAEPPDPGAADAILARLLANMQFAATPGGADAPAKAPQAARRE